MHRRDIHDLVFIPGTRHEVEQLRQRVEKVENLRDEKQEERFRKMTWSRGKHVVLLSMWFQNLLSHVVKIPRALFLLT